MRKLFVLLFTLLFLMAIPAAAFAAYNQNPEGEPQLPAPTTNAPVLAQPFTPTLPDGDEQDNGIGNANATGFNIELDVLGVADNSGSANQDVNNVIKSKDMKMNDFTTTKHQRTHGEYQNNSNSCASCHQTHTGAGKDLLLKKGVYNSCTACHDGTLGFYNVFKESTAGTFGGTDTGNPSVHLANGTLPVFMAPGFADDSGTNDVKNDSFDCAGCHAPHGSYSDRILHYSPNGMANVPVEKRGNKLDGRNVVNVVGPALPAADSTTDDFIVARTTAGVVGLTDEVAATPVIVVLKKVQTGPGAFVYQLDKTPWVAGFEHQANDVNTYTLMYTQFHIAAIDPKTGHPVAITEDANQDGKIDKTDRDALDIRYGKAYAKGPKIADAITADIARAYVVKLSGKPGYDPTQVTDFGGIKITAIDTDIYDEQGFGVPISKYCGACHTDYMTHSTRELNGVQVYRHSTDKDRFNCLKCHFAHGTDVSIMKDARDRNAKYLVDNHLVADKTAAEAYLLDKNPSSALKRYTNMSVCWKCHSGVSGKSSKLMNNDYYWANYGDNAQGGFNSVLPLEDNWTNNNWE